MKIKLILYIAISIALVNAAKAQCPLAFDYQTVVRDAARNPLINTQVAMRFTIYDSINHGTQLYQETFMSTTNQFGLVTLKIGNGTPAFGGLSNINWSAGQKYMQVEMDVTGGSNYVNMGSEIWASVPYALYADSARKGGYPKHYIGEYYGGGIVFYVTDNGQHGLIADSADLQTGNNSEQWSSSDTTGTTAVLQGIGGGSLNTERSIVTLGAGNYAAQLCANYAGGGYGDWFLPSVNELSILYSQQQVVGSFSTSSSYWSSTETGVPTATVVDFSNGATSNTLKSLQHNVRAIRAF